MASSRVALFGIEIDPLSMQGAVETITTWLDDDTLGRFVVTPNVDHVVMLQHHEGLRSAYRDASLVLADGFPLIVASKWLGKPLPQRVAGSELIPKLFEALNAEKRNFTVYLLGAMPGIGMQAARKIQQQWPHLNVVGTYSPPLGFENNPIECEAILARIADVAPDMLIVGLGAPKQELWVHSFQHRISAKAVFCVGATIDFLAGHKRQAPVWMRRMGIEWLHRMASEPRRLAKRYLFDACQFPVILQREWRKHHA